MFLTIAFVSLMALLILSGGAAIHIGVFKVHRPGTGFAIKFFGGIVSYVLSAAAWLLMYSHYYLGW
jgi:hypothetical protein